MKNLIAPHGSDTLKPLYIEDSSERDSLIKASENMPHLLLNSAAAANAVMLGAGYFTPLDGYMDKKNATNVSENMITSDGLFWPVPIINLSKNIDGINVGDEIALLDPNVEGNPVIAIQRVDNVEKLSDEDKDPVLSMVDELESLLQNEEGVAKELDEIDEAAVQAKVKEIEEGMHAISAKLYEAAAAEMAEQEESGEEPSDDGVVDADFEVVDEDED